MCIFINAEGGQCACEGTQDRDEALKLDQMLAYKYLLPVLALCFLIDELYAFLLPDRLRSARRLNRDVSSHLSEISDLGEFMPDNGGEMTQDWEPNPAKSVTAFSPPVEHVPVLPKPQHPKSKDKSRARVTVPLDRIGNSYLSSRNRKDEPEEEHSEALDD
ncbi:hypothetical protein NFI96_023897 [Prochilodus magdalenae]|nr:hypothetical protein NFI96_023897 [Prochilodus magdalenae]